MQLQSNVIVVCKQLAEAFQNACRVQGKKLYHVMSCVRKLSDPADADQLDAMCSRSLADADLVVLRSEGPQMLLDICSAKTKLGDANTDARSVFSVPLRPPRRMSLRMCRRKPPCPAFLCLHNSSFVSKKLKKKV